MNLYLEGLEADITPKNVKLILQANELTEIKTRQVSITNRFELPLTPNNVQLMESLSLMGNESKKPYERISSKLVVDGIEYYFTTKITKTKDCKYFIQLINETHELFDVIANKSIRDIDWSGFNHYMNIGIYSFNVSAVNAYTYGVSDYGQGISTPIDVCAQLPNVYKKYIWDKIFDDAGYTYVADFYDTELFQNEVVSLETAPPACGLLVEDLTAQSESSTEPSPSIGVGVTNDSTHDILEQDDYRYEINFTGIQNEIEFNHASKVRFEGDFSGLTNYGFGVNVSTTINIFKNGVLEYTQTETGTPTATGSFSTVIEVVKGDKVHINQSTTATPTSLSGTLQVTSSLDSYNITLVEPYINFSEMLEDISQSDFIRDVMRSYLLVFAKEPCENEYTFKMMEDLLNERELAEDWSNKYCNTVEETYSLGQYGISNKFQFKYPEGLNRIYDSEHLSSNLNQKEDSTIVSSIYTASASGGSFIGESIVRTDHYELNNEVYEPKSINTKSLKVESIYMNLNLIDGNGNTTGINQNVNILRPIHMDEYRDMYYPSFLRIVDAPVKLIIEAYLTPTDIKNIDFLKLVYLEQNGQYYYKNKITFQNAKKSIVELVQAQGYTSEADRKCIATGRDFNPNINIKE